MLNKFLPREGNRKILLSTITLVRMQKPIVVKFLMKEPEPTSQILKKDLEFCQKWMLLRRHIMRLKKDKKKV
jgi:hypothetical protein